MISIVCMYCIISSSFVNSYLWSSSRSVCAQKSTPFAPRNRVPFAPRNRVPFAPRNRSFCTQKSTPFAPRNRVPFAPRNRSFCAQKSTPFAPRKLLRPAHTLRLLKHLVFHTREVFAICTCISGIHANPSR